MSTPQLGDSIWIDDATDMFVLARVAEVRKDGRLVATVGQREEIVGPPFHLYNENDATLEDLVQMLNVDPPNILNALQARLLACSAGQKVRFCKWLLHAYNWSLGPLRRVR